MGKTMANDGYIIVKNPALCCLECQYARDLGYGYECIVNKTWIGRDVIYGKKKDEKCPIQDKPERKNTNITTNPIDWNWVNFASGYNKAIDDIFGKEE